MRTYSRRSEFNAFSQYDLTALLDGQKAKLAQAIRDEDENYLLNVNREEYLKHIEGNFQIAPLEIHHDQLTLSSEEMLISANLFSQEFNVRPGKSYPKLVITYHLPFDGDTELINTQPSTWGTWTPSIWLEGKTICFEFIDFRQDAQETTRRKDEVLRSLIQSTQNVNNQITAFNVSLRAGAEQIFDQRKQQLLDRKNYLAALNIPIRATQQTTNTYAAPAPLRINPIAPKPAVTTQQYESDPTLDTEIYHQILKVIHDVGTGFEKLPSTYTGLDEETLRDHFLIALAPNFQGTATGETFNKEGKTDILLRHECSNLFVAECKIWKGPKVCLQTVTQLISYLTWRDSKAAVLFFVRNQNFSEVLSALRSTVIQHPNYLGEGSPSSETWFNFRFHVNGDRNREIKVAILLFHFPPLDEQ